MLRNLTADCYKSLTVCRFFYASSACIYPEFKQLETTNVSLKESDAWPAEVFIYLAFDNLGFKLMKLMLCIIVVISLKTHMGWKNLLLKSYANITPKILELNAGLEGSITYMVLLAHGKVAFFMHSGQKYKLLIYTVRHVFSWIV